MYSELDDIDKRNMERINQMSNNGNFQELINEMVNLDYLYEYEIIFSGVGQNPQENELKTFQPVNINQYNNANQIAPRETIKIDLGSNRTMIPSQPTAGVINIKNSGNPQVIPSIMPTTITGYSHVNPSLPVISTGHPLAFRNPQMSFHVNSGIGQNPGHNGLTPYPIQGISPSPHLPINYGMSPPKPTLGTFQLPIRPK